MTPEQLQKRKRILAGIFAVLVIIVMGVLFTLPGPNKNSNGTTDSNTTASEEDKSVVYSGFGTLSDYGFTTIQMNGVKFMLHKFKPDARELSVEYGSIQQLPYDPDNPTPSIKITFPIRLDNITYNATVDKYMDLTTIKIVLKNSADTVAFDSGDFNYENATNASLPDLGD